MRETNFKWMVYALLFLILYYVSKENVYIWFSGISAFFYGISVTSTIIELKEKRKWM